MSKAVHLFKLAGTLSLLLLLAISSSPAAETVSFQKRDASLYADIYDQNIHDELTSYLRLDRLFRGILGIENPSKNVNRYDEVPDSSFFTNRHGRKRLSIAELKRGPAENDGPDLSGKMTIVRGKFEGLHPGFFVKDSRGDNYLIKFDPVDHLEMATGAEMIASRFYHAAGYNVPQYTIVTFPAEKLVVGPEAMVYDESGFLTELTDEKLQETLLFLPQDKQGHYRASASKILAGRNKGPFSYSGRRRRDPQDTVNHADRREIRALQVFGSWIGNYDTRESNTLDMEVMENGKTVLKHYLIDFNATLGSSAGGQKPPMFDHEHLIDFESAARSFLGLGFYAKPWQKRWEEVGGRSPQSPAIGYFDNRYYAARDFSTQLPYYGFKDLTTADGFWAAKILMAFSDDDVRALTGTGQYSRESDSEELARILIERRDLLGKYWFERISPLDRFDVKEGRVVFEDLAVKFGFSAARRYEVLIFSNDGGSRKKVREQILAEPSLEIEGTGSFEIRLRAEKDGGGWLPPVRVRLNEEKIEAISRRA